MSAIKPQEESNLSVRTLQLLERERKRYRCLSQMSGEILFDYDRETDTIEYTDRYCEIFGGTNVVLHAADAMKNPNISMMQTVDAFMLNWKNSLQRIQLFDRK